jgi:hypothetical protein
MCVMSEQRDFTISNGLGIRIVDGRICQAIRRQRGAWKEIGQRYELPLRSEDLKWTRGGIPASVIAVALRAYELSCPGSALRQELTSNRLLRAAS